MREKIRNRKMKDYERGGKEELRKRRSRDGEEEKITERKKKGRFMELKEEGR